MSNRPSRPLWVTANITGVCNLSCSYCFFQPRKHEHMPIPSFRKLAGILKEQEIFFLTLSGGEPFMHPDINEILTFSHEQFEHVSVLSNGTKISDDNIRCIGEIIKTKGYFPMQVSLDALDSDTNDRTRGMTNVVRKNLDILAGANVSLTLAMVVSSQNINSVVQTITELKCYTRHFHLMPFKPVPFLERKDDYLHAESNDMSSAWERLDELRATHDLSLRLPTDECGLQEYSAAGAPCVAGFTQVVIDPNMDVRACSRCTHSYIGNLEKESMEEIWNGEKLAHIYKRETPYCFVPSEWDKFATSGYSHA